jgi:hypothetical protein
MAFTTQTRWSVCNDHWEIRLLNNGIEIARMSWREWQNLPANYPFASGPEMPNDILADDLFLAAVSENKRRRRAALPQKARLTVVDGGLE